MKIWKYLVSLVLGVSVVTAGMHVLAAPVPFPYTDNNYTTTPTADAGQLLKQTSQNGSLLENLLTLFGINYSGPDKALSYVQVIINYVLSILGLIALVMIIYSFYMIFTGKAEDGISSAKKTVI
ncbi:MAG: hypothetical protein WCJ81_06000 [bacterium]